MQNGYLITYRYKGYPVRPVQNNNSKKSIPKSGIKVSDKKTVLVYEDVGNKIPRRIIKGRK